MSVRAKFTVTSITRNQGSRQETCADPANCPVGANWHDGMSRHSVPAEVQTIGLAPVYGNGDPNHENTKFWQASPSGQIQLGTVNLAAAQQFELGAEYYVDFTKAE